LLGIAGSGSIKVLESKLWSIPVFRALFGQLGLDSTAVFDSMSTNFNVRDGLVDMHDITVRSPLLQLVGQGTLDFDGGLKYDLEVRYDLIDRLGPITRLFTSSRTSSCRWRSAATSVGPRSSSRIRSRACSAPDNARSARCLCPRGRRCRSTSEHTP
jgi:hypothetical protein